MRISPVNYQNAIKYNYLKNLNNANVNFTSSTTLQNNREQEIISSLYGVEKVTPRQEACNNLIEQIDSSENTRAHELASQYPVVLLNELTKKHHCTSYQILDVLTAKNKFKETPASILLHTGYGVSSCSGAYKHLGFDTATREIILAEYPYNSERFAKSENEPTLPTGKQVLMELYNNLDNEDKETLVASFSDEDRELFNSLKYN